jgi:hypothetical protein
MKVSKKSLFVLLALALFAVPATAKRISSAYTLTQADSAGVLTNTSSGPVTVAIPHTLTLPFSVLINGGHGGVNLSVLTADLLTADGYIDPGTSALLTVSGNNTNNTITITVPAVPIAQTLPLTGTTSSIGGGALLAGACTSGTAAVTGSTTAMSAIASPVTYPGDGAMWDAYVSTAGTVTVKVCALVGVTPSATAYNVRVIQ